jgi:cellulose biosynthesis protein BcsQ
VKGGAKALVRKRRPIDDVIRSSDYPNLDVVPADLSYRHLDLALDRTKRPAARLRTLLAPLADQYEYVFLDCAPSMSLVSESIFAAADALVVPVIPTTLSVRTLDQLTAFLATHTHGKTMVLPFFSLADRRKRLHRDVMATMPATPGGMLDASVPSATEVEQMGRHRAPVAAFAPASRAARGYRQLWDDIRKALG